MTLGWKRIKINVYLQRPIQITHNTWCTKCVGLIYINFIRTKLRKSLYADATHTSRGGGNHSAGANFFLTRYDNPKILCCETHGPCFKRSKNIWPPLTAPPSVSALIPPIVLGIGMFTCFFGTTANWQASGGLNWIRRACFFGSDSQSRVEYGTLTESRASLCFSFPNLADLGGNSPRLAARWLSTAVRDEAKLALFTPSRCLGPAGSVITV